MNAQHPNAIDIHVGRRMRERRIALGISQETFGNALNGDEGLSFQQVQKYEKGRNRISASRLLEIAGALKVDIGYFFIGLPGGTPEGITPDPAADAFVGSREGQSLIRAFAMIRSTQLRRAVMNLADDLAIGEAIQQAAE